MEVAVGAGAAALLILGVLATSGLLYGVYLVFVLGTQYRDPGED